MKDLFMRGITAGLIGSVGDFIIHYTAFFLLRTSTTAHYIAQLLFPFVDINPARYWFGLLIHFLTGAFVGVILIELSKRYGDDDLYFKAIALGVGIWIIHVAVIPNIINLPERPFLHRTEFEALVDLLAHIVFGIFAASYLRLADVKR